MWAVGILQTLRAGVADAVAGAVTGAQLSSATPVLSPSPSTTSPLVPPLELGSPWVSSDLNTVLVDVLGAENLPLTRDAAMRIPAVARARNIVCPTLGRVPFVLNGGQPPEAVALLSQPDPTTSRFLTLTWTYDDCLFHGVSWWQVTARYGSGRPRHVRRILPGGVTRHDGGGWRVYGQPVKPSELLRIDGPHEGILNYAGVTLRQAAQLEAAAGKMARNPIPGIDLHQTSGVTLTKQERQELISDWAKSRQGENGGVAYTSPQIDARVLGAPAEQLLTQGRNFTAVDVARHVSIPADAIDASVPHASMTYSTSQTKMQALIDFGLSAYAAAVTARLSLDDVTPHGITVGLDYDQITAVADADPSTPAPAAPAPAGAGAGPRPERPTP